MLLCHLVLFHLQLSLCKAIRECDSCTACLHKRQACATLRASVEDSEQSIHAFSLESWCAQESMTPYTIDYLYVYLYYRLQTIYTIYTIDYLYVSIYTIDYMYIYTYSLSMPLIFFKQKIKFGIPNLIFLKKIQIWIFQFGF